MGNQLYHDMNVRTHGEMYIGVVGPVRTGKSTFIKRFMELMVLPGIENEQERKQAIDELPQSSYGKTIMTVEPKFVPQKAREVEVEDGVFIKVRLIDCVGYLVQGANGHLEDGKERMVMTPWFEKEVPFKDAAAIGTQKVIADHSTMGIVVTTDGSIGEIAREDYLAAERQTIEELQIQNKPFVIILNSKKPYGEDTIQLALELEAQYHVAVLPINCEQLKKKDIQMILEAILKEFPVKKINFHIPKWMELLSEEHTLKKQMMEYAKSVLQSIEKTKDITKLSECTKPDVIKKCSLSGIDYAKGEVNLLIEVAVELYYQYISNLLGEKVTGEYQLISYMKELSGQKKEYAAAKDAIGAVKQKGYGVIYPERENIELEEPELIRHGNKYGVKLKASCPSIHLIRANIETEIAPIVGSEEQAKDLMEYIGMEREKQQGVWDTNIFGKTIGELVEDEIHGKIMKMDDECQMKLQSTMQKIVNDSNGGMVCIII